MENLKVSNFAISWKGAFTINNTRRAFKIAIEHQTIKPKSVKLYANFAVVRYEQVKFVYIIFYSGHINCTGISKFGQVIDALQFFRSTYLVGVTGFKVKAIAATSKISFTLKVKDISRLLKFRSKSIAASVVSNRFTGLMLRFANGGSAQLFYSGKINFLGAKNIYHLKWMNSVVRTFVHHGLRASGKHADSRSA